MSKKRTAEEIAAALATIQICRRTGQDSVGEQGEVQLAIPIQAAIDALRDYGDARLEEAADVAAIEPVRAEFTGPQREMRIRIAAAIRALKEPKP